MAYPTFLSARTHEKRDVAIRHLLDALAELGNVVGTRTFSGLLLVLEIEMPRARVPELGTRLRELHIPLEAKSVEALATLVESRDEDVSIVLDVNFVDGDPDLRDIVPNVPG